MTDWKTYVGRDMRSVEGWLDPMDARMIAAVAARQLETAIAGSVAEIGVHHGKLFILLNALRQPGENALAIDVFEEQSKNIDRSGRGDRERFLANLERAGGKTSDVAILARSSLEVAAADIINSAGPVRIFSIDGGHTAECTRNDLVLASDTVVDGGLVILDDYFNPHWPDVSIGAASALSQTKNRLVPFAVGRNKVLFTTASASENYRSVLRSEFSHVLVRTSEMAGAKVDVFGVLHTLPNLWEIAKMQVRRGNLGKSIVSAGRALRGSDDS